MSGQTKSMEFMKMFAQRQRSWKYYANEKSFFGLSIKTKREALNGLSNSEAISSFFIMTDKAGGGEVRWI
jgi:hypothetical protein